MKRICFISTGGTISCAPTENGLAPELSSEQLLEYVPEIGQLCEVETRQLCTLDSTNMSPREWVKLATVIRSEYERFDGFVAAHGTDTMAYAAAALSCLVQNSEKPIVLTGSQQPMKAEKTDARDNLLGAFRYATAEGAWGVRIAFGGRIIDGKTAYKYHTREFDAFRSTEEEPAGFDENGVHLNPHKPHSGKTLFFDKMDSRVAVIKLTPGAPASVLDVQGIRAAIIEGYGTGGLPDYGDGGYEKALDRLSERGVYLIFATQVRCGGTELSRYAVGNRFCGRVLETGTMTTEFAAMKAMWALAYSDNYDEFKRLFAAEI